MSGGATGQLWGGIVVENNGLQGFCTKLCIAGMSLLFLASHASAISPNGPVHRTAHKKHERSHRHLSTLSHLLECSTTPSKNFLNCKFEILVDRKSYTYQIGGRTSDATHPKHHLDQTDLLKAAQEWSAMQLSTVLSAARIYAAEELHTVLFRRLACGNEHLLNQTAAPNEHAFYISVEGALRNRSCDPAPFKLMWMRLAASFLSELIAKPSCDSKVADFGSALKERFIDANLLQVVFSDQVSSKKSVEIERLLLLAGSEVDACANNGITVNKNVFLNTPLRPLFLFKTELVRDRDYNSSKVAPPFTLGSIYQRAINKEAADTKKVAELCDVYDPNWVRNRITSTLIDVAALAPGCFVFAPRGGAGKIKNSGSRIFSGYGSVVFLEDSKIDAERGELGAALFAKPHKVDEKLRLRSFPVFFGISERTSEAVDELITFHFQPTFDRDLAKQKVVSAKIDHVRDRILMVEDEGGQQDIERLFAPRFSEIQLDKLEHVFGVSLSGLAGTPVKQPASSEAVCRYVRNAKQRNARISPIDGWDQVISADDIQDKRAFCAFGNDLQCLVIVLTALGCFSDRPSPDVFLGDKLRLDVRAWAMENGATDK